jgi:large subunit ribosomal protein L25|tara:strand:- start:321 stop:977 length:657 start_codon:yes stop_codon:yes gene_type:complete
MSIDFSLDAESRSDLGKGASRRLRHTGRVPAILYGAGVEPENISLDHNKIRQELENEAFYSHILTINLAGKKQKVILRDLQRHPAKPVILHVDFLRVSDDQEINIHVPLHFINEDICHGVKTESGQISHLITEVEISCLPKHIPEFIEIDLTELHIGDSVHLTELTLPEGVVLTALTHGEGHDQLVVNVHATKVAEEEPTDAPVAPANEDDDKPTEGE